MGIYFCYLLTSLKPTCKNHTYVGFTVFPARRIRQHNGEIKNGAKKTMNKRPWDMVATVYGFTSKVSALQFEWAWQNPHKAIKVRDVITNKQGIGKGVLLRDKIRILWEMCSIPPWSNQPLIINIFPQHQDLLNKLHREKRYVWPKLPMHVEIQYSELKDIPRNSTNTTEEGSNVDEGGVCYFCEDIQEEQLDDRVRCPNYKPNDDIACSVDAHVHCFAEYFLRSEAENVLIPKSADCPSCGSTIAWPLVIASKYKSSQSNSEA